MTFIGKHVIQLYSDKVNGEKSNNQVTYATVTDVDNKISKLATCERVDSIGAMCKENRVLINKQIEKTSEIDGEVISLGKDVEHILSEFRTMNNQIVEVIRSQTEQIKSQTEQIKSMNSVIDSIKGNSNNGK